MKDNKLDRIIAQKLENLQSPPEEGVWSAFEEKLSNSLTPQHNEPASDRFDDLIKEKIASVQPIMPVDSWDRFEQEMDTTNGTESAPKENNPSNQILIGSIKNEVNIFVNRIGTFSGADNIQISPGKDLDFETLNIDKETLVKFCLGGVLASGALFSYFMSLKYIPVSIAMALANIEPLFTILLARFSGISDAWKMENKNACF